jgi:tRNA(His) guanylyltransferase
MGAEDDLESRIKFYQEQSGYCNARLIPRLPAVARIDGKKFSSFTSDLQKPYELGLSKLMADTVKFLVQATNACIGYTQSDEITLIWGGDRPTYFDGRINKINSVLASKTSVYFNRKLGIFLPEKEKKVAESNPDRWPVFDCRVFNTPDLEEACNVIMWREWDAAKNLVSMAAQANYSHKELDGVNTSQMQEMLFAKGINWNDYPAFFKRGQFIQTKMVKRPYSADQIEKLPAKHAARANPNLEVERRQIIEVDMPIFSKVVNRVDVVFYGAEPKVAEVV